MELPPFANLVFELSSYAIAIAVFVKVLREDHFQLFLYLSAIVATIAAEELGMRFSHGYYYSDFLIKVAGNAEGMPLCIALDWAVIVFCIWRLGMRLDVKWYLLPLVFGVLAVPLDLVLDPLASWSKSVPEAGVSCNGDVAPILIGSGLGYWVWCVSPQNVHLWFDVPLGNFIGWFMLVTGFTFSALLAQRWLAKKSNIGRFLIAGVGVVVGTLVIEVTTMMLFAQLEKVGLSSNLVLLGLLASGMLVILTSGNRRTQRSFDGWALVAWGSVTAFCVTLYFTSLSGFAGSALVLAGVTILALSLGLSLWVMRGWSQPSSSY